MITLYQTLHYGKPHVQENTVCQIQNDTEASVNGWYPTMDRTFLSKWMMTGATAMSQETSVVELAPNSP